MSQVIAILVGLLLLAAAGVLVAYAVDSWSKVPDKPKTLPDAIWHALTHGAEGGVPFGILERWLLFAAFYGQSLPLAGAWLAFKLASKWEVWKNIVRVPGAVDGMSPAEWFAFTHAAGSWILQRFWIGTLANVLLALATAEFVRNLPQLDGWCP